MNQTSQPIFYDPSGRRSWLVSRLGAVLAALVALGGTLFVLSLLVVPLLPSLSSFVPGRGRRLHLPLPPRRSTRIDKYKLEGERAALWEQIGDEKSEARLSSASAQALAHAVTPDAPIVAAFYASWESTGLSSLRANASHLTHLLPVWLRLDKAGAGLDLEDWNLDVNPGNRQVVQIAHDNGLQVWPVLSNADDETFDPQRVHALLSSPSSQEKLALAIRTYLVQNHFNGLNIDFENLAAADYARLPAFVSLLKARLATAKLGVSADVETDVAPSAMQALGNACDFVVLMAYNEHSTEGPGAIASAPWVTKITKRALKAIPPQKLVMGIENYAYDWTEGENDYTPLTYQSALYKLVDNNPDEKPQQVVDFDPVDLNATGKYEDDNGKNHEVWMLDAASAYNQWHIAQRTKLRGSALWVLGAEDPGLWSFYRRGPILKPLSKSNLHEMARVQFPYQVDFEGDGEVLNVVGTPHEGERTFETDPRTGFITDQEYSHFPSPYVVQRSGYNGAKELALTFDDGPDPQWTPQILDALHDLDVPGTFFMVGSNVERYPGLVRQIYSSGYDIGNHTFTHTDLGQASPHRAKLEINATQRAIESITGHSTVLFRPPYNADAEPQTAEEVKPVAAAAQLGYVTVGELIDPQDWEPTKIGPDDQPVPRTVADLRAMLLFSLAHSRGNMILLHDAGGDRSKTVELLRQIVPELQNKGYKFVTVSHLMGVSRDKVMPPVSAKERLLLGFDKAAFSAIFGTEWLLATCFIAAIGLGVGRILFVLPLAYFARLREKRRVFDPTYQPLVSVIIAAYNERPVIERTIRSVLASEYPHLEVIVVDDGSKDGTGDEVEEHFAHDPRVRLMRQVNGGKATALNHALQVTTGDIFVGFDADTQVAYDAISLMVRHFNNPRIGAVAGNVKVGNRTNLVTQWQSLEYITTQNLDRRAYGLLNAITVVPGAIGAWRTSAVREVGGYVSDTLAEDMDLTWRLRRANWRLVTESDALAFTEAPDTFRAFFKQRFRWSYGTLQCLSKHKSALGRYGWFGMFALPGLWVFQIALNALAPFVDFQLGYAALSAGLSWLQSGLGRGVWAASPDTIALLQQTGFFYALFFGVELAGAFLAFRLDREKPTALVWLFWQRFVYRQLLYGVVWKAMWTALSGLRQGWGKLARKGTVQMPVTEG